MSAEVKPGLDLDLSGLPKPATRATNGTPNPRSYLAEAAAGFNRERQPLAENSASVPAPNSIQQPVRGGSRTSSNQGTATGSSSLRDEPVRTAVRSAAKKTPNRTTLVFEDLDAFMARTESLPDPTWLIDQLVPDAGRLLLAATASAGKTFLCLVIARYAAELGRTVYLVLEEGGAKATANRFRSLAFKPGASVRVLHQAGITLARHTAALAEMLREGVAGPAPVLVLDPFASVFSGNENDTEEVAAAVAMMNTLMRADPRVLLVVPHHTSKAGERGEVGTPMHVSRGGTGLPAWADVQLNLKHVVTPKGSGRVEFDALVAKNRDGERDYTVRVTIELGSGAVTFKAAAEAQREAKEVDLRERVVAHVTAKASRAKPLTKNGINSEVKGTKTVINELVDTLTTEGILKNDGAGWYVPQKHEESADA